MRNIQDHGLVKLLVGIQVVAFVHYHRWDFAVAAGIVFLACLAHDIRATMTANAVFASGDIAMAIGEISCCCCDDDDDDYDDDDYDMHCGDPSCAGCNPTSASTSK